MALETEAPIPDLLAATAALVAIPSESHSEAALANHVEARLRDIPGLSITRIASNVVARTDAGADTRVVIAGHLDTVPANGNTRPKVDGDTLWGLGSADMKGGLAVMLALAAAIVDPAVDVSYVFYSGEEVSREYSGLLEIEAAAPQLLRADAAVLGEPTCARIEAGCQGVLRLEVELGGARAHTARPWMGVNAVHRLAPLLARVAAYESRQPVVDGCQYREALQAVKVSGGVAGNVVPDRASVVLNHRFAPDRDAKAAEKAVRTLLEPVLDADHDDRVTLLESQPAAPPSLTHPLLNRLLLATGLPPKAKLGWTDVAFFAERGVPAVNFGPGDPELAHTADERVTRSDLNRAYESLRDLLTAPTGPDQSEPA
ncbi:MAG TPA: succinyl-diaminopimelate desuccinylase [Acidimicrobiales bacterium]|nr:succinyl-diaminopimelate desuccinylase [Acidimicrobiales bacterium]